MRSRRTYWNTLPWMLAGCLVLGCGSGDDGAAARASALDAPSVDVERYDLTGEYDWTKRRLIASVGVTLDRAHTPPSRIVLDSRVPLIRGVRLDSGASLPFSADEHAGTLAIDLGEHAAPGVRFVIDYEASPPMASGQGGVTPLMAIGPRPGDPLSSRVVYTYSEPETARTWMPSHDAPNDRAYFSIDLHVGAGERLIANGDVVADTTANGKEGRTKYQTAYPIPTYLMAFALGEFQVERARGPHGLPLSIWHRPGLAGEYRSVLDLLDRMVRRIERLTGVPYPFEKYSLVLLPDFPGGEEHAGITFQGEMFTAQPDLERDARLTTHELAHQWFGDLVTVETWNDLWIKEGMATVIQWEGTRAFLNRDDSDLHDGDLRGVASGEAIRDGAIAPLHKYNSGPYDRSAWLLTQIRALAGERAFWGTLHDVLTSHRFGAIGSEAFLDAFLPAIGPQAVAAAKRALDVKALPALTVEALAGGGGRVTLHDPEGTMVMPMQAAWHRADGSVDTFAFAPGVATDVVRRSPNDLLVIDPQDVHPAWSRLVADAASRNALSEVIAPLRVPVGEDARARFLEEGGAHQLAALLEGALPAMDPRDFPDFLRDLDSDAARATAVARACDVAANDAGWAPLVKRVLQRQPFSGGLRRSPTFYTACSQVAPPSALFPDAWRALSRGLSTRALDETQVAYLQKFPAAAGEMLRIWSAVVQKGYSSRVRFEAAITLSTVASDAALMAGADRAAWRARIAELLEGDATWFVNESLIETLEYVAGPRAVDNASGLHALSSVLHTPGVAATHAAAACTAYRLTAQDANAWQAFVESVADAETSESARAILSDPAGTCG